mgnify:CR=1 FL=1|tara:strand:- start:31596 stop:32354 length:759 start_codon:yes stop_codon:yes gene_type:complete
MNEEKKIKKIRNKIKSGKLSLGSWIQIPHPDVAKIISNQGYDWVCIDLEHGSGSMKDIPSLSNTITSSKSACFVRIADDNFKNINRFLDFSIGGIIFSKIEDHAKLSDMLSKLYFPPHGTRGYGFSINNNFGKNKVTLKDLKFRPLSVAMIETVNGLKNLENITKIKNLDAIFIGPYDLSISLGIPGQFKNKKYINAVQKIILICKKNRKPLGIHVVEPNLKELKEKANQGFNFIAYSMDTVCLNKNLIKPI